MVQIALRGVRNNPFRYLATAIAIVLGVTFFVATSVLTTSFQDTLSGSIAEAFEDIDGAVRSSDSIDTEFIEIRPAISSSVADDISGIDGVKTAEPYLAGYAQAVTPAGKVIDSGGQPPQGFAWIEDEETNPYKVVDGAPPVAANEVAIDQNTFDDGEFVVGEEVRILPLPADQPFVVSGVIVSNGDETGGQALAFSFDGAVAVFGTSDVDQIFVVADEGVSQQQLVDNIAADLPPELEAITGDELVAEFDDIIGTVTGIINTALQVFAGISLFVGAFVIYNTFSITVAQRTREMALLRAIGASSRQVSRSVIVESIIIGLLASLVGAVVGIGLGWVLIKLLSSFAGGFDIALTIPPGTLGAGVVIGTIITVSAAYFPARRGAKVAPIEALRESTIEADNASKVRTGVGLAMIVIGMFFSVRAVTGGELTTMLIGLPFVMISIVLLGPVVVRPLSRIIAVPFVRNGSITGELARENASRNPKRSATTSLTLMIGVALVVTATVFASTLSTSIRGSLEDELAADQVVEIGQQIAQLGGGMDPTVAPAIAALNDVQAAVPLRSASAEIQESDGNSAFAEITGTDTATVDQVLNLEVLDGDINGLGTDSIALDEDQADSENLTVGDTVAVKFPQNTATLTVAAIFEPSEVLSGWVVDNDALEANTTRSLDARILVRSNEGASEGVAAEITDIVSGDPTAKVKTSDEFISDQAGAVDNLLVLLYGLLGMSVVVALIGIVNTMALSIHERTRELGLLRAVGMTATQLRRIVRYESTIIALIGTMLGLLLGLFFGWLASKASEDVFPQFAIPYGTLVIIAVVGVVAGLLAGVLPARRAGKLNVLEAIASE